MVWILIGYMFLFVHRPFEVWPILAEMRLERCYALFAIVAVAVSNPRWPNNPLHLGYLGLASAVLVAWLASPWADRCQPLVEDYFKILVFYVLLVTTVRDEKTLRTVVTGFLVVMTIYMLHSLKEYLGGRHVYRMGIARMIGVDTSQGDPNSFGASIVFALPFVVPFWRDRPSKAVRLALAGYVALSALCIGLTGSRSSFLGLIVAALIMALGSRYRWRWIGGAAVGAPLAFIALPGSLQERFETIINPEAGSKVAMDSGYSRLEGLFTGLELWARNPLTGVGPGAWRPASGSALESHNLYGQLLGELGSLGAIAFLGILAGCWINRSAIASAYRRHPDWGDDFLRQVVHAALVGVFLMLFEGNFGHNLFRHNWLWYGAFLIAARECVRRRVRAQRWAGVRPPQPGRAGPVIPPRLGTAASAGRTPPWGFAG